jgi:heat shock protein HslJ
VTAGGPLAWIGVLALAACAAAPPSGPTAGAAGDGGAPLTGTRWVGVVEGNADPRTLPRLEFAAAGRLSGYTGCNMLSGTWEERDGAPSVGRLLTTKRMCAGPEGEVERRFLRALGEGTRARREPGRLVFTGPGGERFEFTPAAVS